MSGSNFNVENTPQIHSNYIGPRLAPDLNACDTNKDDDSLERVEENQPKIREIREEKIYLCVLSLKISINFDSYRLTF